MKSQKSSYSLHTTSSSVFRERPTNIFHPSPSNLLLKRQVSYSKQTSSIYNARARLAHSTQLHSQLLALSEEVAQANKVLAPPRRTSASKSAF